MMKEEVPFIDALRGIGMLQQELAKTALYISGYGPIQFEGQRLECTLGDSQRRVSCLLAMAAGQSLQSVLRMSDMRGIPVRDIYPIARSALETYVNAAMLAAESDEVAQRAIDYVQYAAWRLENRKFGSGEYTIEVNSDPDPANTLSTQFPQFAGKGKGVWTTLDMASRIKRIGDLAGRRAGSRFLGGYGQLYSVSSEIIHGSPFGVSYFYSGFRNGRPATTEEFVRGTVRHLEEMLIAVLHANCGYLATFFGIQKMSGPLAMEQKIFDRLLEVSTKPANEFPKARVKEPGASETDA